LRKVENRVNFFGKKGKAGPDYAGFAEKRSIQDSRAYRLFLIAYFMFFAQGLYYCLIFGKMARHNF